MCVCAGWGAALSSAPHGSGRTGTPWSWPRASARPCPRPQSPGPGRAQQPGAHRGGGCGQARPWTAGWGAPTQRAIEVFLYARLQSPFFAAQQPRFTPCRSWGGGKEPRLPHTDAAPPRGAGLEGAHCSSWLWLVPPQRGPPQSCSLMIPWEVSRPQDQLWDAAQPQKLSLG